MKRWLLIPSLILVSGLAATADCGSCHAEILDTLDATAHAILKGSGEPTLSCKQCHGAGDTHLMNPFAGGILAFDDESVLEKNEACASCHSDAHAAGGTLHEAAGVACSDCHNVHGTATENSPSPAGFEDLVPSSAICADCHADVLAQFAFSKRHRLADNSVTCTDCHDPHAARSAPVLHDATMSVCNDCHAEQQGPFIFEHDASRVDGCLACHSPHGSANRHLLNHQAVGELCFSCHAAMPQFHLGFAPGGPPRFGGDTVCTNCHVTIHGSNLDAAFLK